MILDAKSKKLVENNYSLRLELLPRTTSTGKPDPTLDLLFIMGLARLLCSSPTQIFQVLI